jgi:hypothetical protein
MFVEQKQTDGEYVIDGRVLTTINSHEFMSTSMLYIVSNKRYIHKRISTARHIQTSYWEVAVCK